jgi:putative heme-binding domain-containing protein
MHISTHMSTKCTIRLTSSRARRNDTITNGMRGLSSPRLANGALVLCIHVAASVLVNSARRGTFSLIPPRLQPAGDFMPSRWFFALLVAAVVGATVSAQEPPHVATTEKLSPAEERAKIHLPPGFELQLVASEPDIHKPLNMNFDERGRLWITDTLEYPYPAKDRPGRDRVMILDDFGPDGKARKTTTFAEGLNIPIGVIPYKDGCIAHSIPSIWRLRDTDGDGKADQKELLLGPFGTRDTHGMVNSFTIGYDGWLYLCHGYLNDSVVKGKDGQELRMNSGNTFRMRPDGTHVEAFTRGQVNPFGLAWDGLGNLYSADCHSMPLTQLLRGAYYVSFGKPNDGLGFAPHMIDFGQNHSTALCGLVFYEADQFPKEYRGQLFMGDVVLTRVNSYKIELTGSSPKATFQKFITSDDPWFRPVDLRLGPDGAIYVADFYNRIIGHYEVPLNHPGRDRDSGRIWRIVWKGTDGKAAPPKRPYDDLTKETPEKLAELLGHPNLTVRMQATNEMAERGAAMKDIALKALKSDSAPRRIQALWVLERIGALDDGTLIRMMSDGDNGVRIHLCRVLAERSSITDRQRRYLLDSLRSGNALWRRCAADALGRHTDSSTLKPILAALHRADAKDTHLVQVELMALRDHIKAGLLANRKADEFEGRERTLARAILGAPSPENAEFLLSLPLDPLQPSEVEFIARHGDDSTVGGLVEKAKQPKPDIMAEMLRFRATQAGLQASGRALPRVATEWGANLAGRLLESKDAGQREAGAELSGSAKLLAMQPQLLTIANDAKQPEGPRAAACAALVAIDPTKHMAVLSRLVLDTSTPAGLRSRVARSLGTLSQSEARAELIKALAVAPAALADGIALGLAATPAGSEALLKAISEGKASPRLLQSRPIQLQLQQHRLRDLDQRLKSLTVGLPPVDDKMNALIRSRLADFTKSKGDVALGQKSFAKHCAACHQIGGQGAKVGPNLDGIGARSPERLLEDMLDPNRNVDPAFRSTRISLKDGRDLQGLVLREEGEVVVMADDKGKEIRIEKKQIEERSVSPISPMPANWADVIPVEEMNHLLAYLLAQKAKDR